MFTQKTQKQFHEDLHKKMINNGDIKEKKGYVSDGIVDFDNKIGN